MPDELHEPPPPEPPGLAHRKISVFQAFGKVIRGNHAEVTLPGGAIVAKIYPPDGRWSLTRREEVRPDEPAEYTLRAVFSYVNLDFIGNELFLKEMTVSMLRGEKLRLVLPNARRLDVRGRSLLTEGVQIWHPADPSQ